MAQIAHAATTVSGAITTNTTWSLAQSPYQVTADVSVENGATLTIEAGVIVYFDAAKNLAISNGALSARGTAGQPITFTSVLVTNGGTPAPGDWGQIRFLNGTNDVATVLEHTIIRFGQGINVQAASPSFNYLQIIDNLGSAISIDLNSSPKGAGSQATGNTLNGISVPAGDVLSSVTWGIKGIPYVVSSGVVSVGASPAITGISPAEAQQSLPVDAVISGTRLAGVESIIFEAEGVTATLTGGATDTSVPVQITASATQPLGNVPFRVKTAAGWVRYATGISVIPLKPTIAVNSITPSNLRRAETRSFQIQGNYLAGAQVSVPQGSGLTVSNLSSTNTQVSFNLTASTTAVLDQQTISVKNPTIANGTGAQLVTVNAVLPKFDLTTIPSIILPDATARTYSLTLDHADTVDHIVNLSVADPSIITVSPATLTIPAGTTSASFIITGVQWGYTTLNITSTTLVSTSKQIFAFDGSVVSMAVTVEAYDAQASRAVVSPEIVVEPYDSQAGRAVISPAITVEASPNSILSPSITVEASPNNLLSPSVTVEASPNGVVSPGVTVEVLP